MCAKQTTAVLRARAAGPKVCPICGKPSYSSGGVHPQCSQQQADEKIGERLKAAKKADAESGATKPKPAAGKIWQKSCPECHVKVHVRQARCACGFVFAQ
jgi:endogenous inhibitor of DNA gyrase (YacG/DUF329 family)